MEVGDLLLQALRVGRGSGADASYGFGCFLAGQGPDSSVQWATHDSVSSPVVLFSSAVTRASRAASRSSTVGGRGSGTGGDQDAGCFSRSATRARMSGYGHPGAARVDLARLPLQVADHRAPLVPAVAPADRGRRPLDRLELGRRPRVLAVAEVLALEAVEVAVAVGVRLVVGGQRRLGDDRAQDVVVAEAGVVGAAVADEVDRAVLGDDAVAQRAGQAAVAVAADVRRCSRCPR